MITTQQLLLMAAVGFGGLAVWYAVLWLLLPADPFDLIEPYADTVGTERNDDMNDYLALVIPEDGAVRTEIIKEASELSQLQSLVGGMIEALPMPEPDATAYINEEGKFDPGCERNERATALMEQSGLLLPGDWIAGPMVVCGFDPNTGENRTCPEKMVMRIGQVDLEYQLGPVIE